MVLRTHQLKTSVGAFENEHAVEAVIQELRAVGFSESQIGLVSRHHRHFAAETTANSEPEDGIGTYCGLRAFVGIAHGVGPVIAGGVLARACHDTASIDTARTLIGLGLSEEDARRYEDYFRAGRTIITVAGGTRVDIAHSVLIRFNRANRLVICAS